MIIDRIPADQSEVTRPAGVFFFYRKFEYFASSGRSELFSEPSKSAHYLFVPFRDQRCWLDASLTGRVRVWCASIVNCFRSISSFFFCFSPPPSNFNQLRRPILGTKRTKNHSKSKSGVFFERENSNFWRNSLGSIAVLAVKLLRQSRLEATWIESFRSKTQRKKEKEKLFPLCL